MRIPGGFRIDNPAWVLIPADIAYWGITTANGNAAGTTLIDALCSTAGLQPSYANQRVKILSGPAAGQERIIAIHTLATGTLQVLDPWTNSTGAVQQILAGTIFCILGTTGGGGGITPSGPIIGFGTLTTSSQTVPADNTRAGLYAWENNDYFKGCILMPIEGNCRYQPRPISQFAVAGGIFTIDEPFSQLPGQVRYVLIRSDYPYQRLIDIFNIVNAILVTTETGGTLTTDATEQNVYINNAPAGVYEPLCLKIDFTNQTAGETLRVRTYYRIVGGGNLRLQDDVSFAGVQTPALKKVDLDPNRFGIQVTAQRTAGVARDYDWSVIYRS
jgi:hypothetical protein